MNTITGSELEALERSGIVSIRTAMSHAPADVSVAKHTPELVEIHAMSGLVYRIRFYSADIDQFAVEEVK